jgi:hypothetical protein
MHLHISELLTLSQMAAEMVLLPVPAPASTHRQRVAPGLSSSSQAYTSCQRQHVPLLRRPN